MTRWYKVTVFGTGRYVDLVEAESKEAAEENHAEGLCLEPTELVSVDGVDIEEATAQEIMDAKQAVRLP